jgi:arsenate reductase
MAEALVNHFFKGQISAYSSGVKASGIVNPDAIKAIKEFGIEDTNYLKSKTLDNVIDQDFDLVVTVCDNAKENCPLFPKNIKTIHVGFEDPTGKKFYQYLKTINNIKETLLPIVKKELIDS